MPPPVIRLLPWAIAAGESGASGAIRPPCRRPAVAYRRARRDDLHLRSGRARPGAPRVRFSSFPGARWRRRSRRRGSPGFLAGRKAGTVGQRGDVAGLVYTRRQGGHPGAAPDRADQDLAGPLERPAEAVCTVPRDGRRRRRRSRHRAHVRGVRRAPKLPAGTRIDRPAAPCAAIREAAADLRKRAWRRTCPSADEKRNRASS
jgi:hypothetical protein